MDTFLSGKYVAGACICVLAPILSVLAQPGYTIPQLVAAANQHLPLLLEKNAEINSARAAVTETRHSFLPRLHFNDQLNIGSANSVAGAYLPLGYTPSVSAAVRAENNFTPATGNIAVVYGEYELVNFGEHQARLQQSEAYVHLQEADLQQQLYQLKSDVAHLYLSLLKTQYRLQADSLNSDRYRSIYTVIHALVSSGLRPGSDTSLTKAELSKAKITYTQTLAAVNDLKQQMSYLTGIPPGQMLLHTDTSAFRLHLPEPVPAFPSATDLSLHPALNYYRTREEIYRSNENLINKSYLPRIMLAGSTWARGSSIQSNDSYGALLGGWGYDRLNYMAGVALTYDLFTGIHKRDRLQVNRFNTQASEEALMQEQLTLQSAAARADNYLQMAETNLRELPVQSRSAEETYYQKLAQYRAGIITLIDLTNASFVLYRSQTDYIETVSDWYLAQLDKAAALGRLDQFIQTIP